MWNSRWCGKWEDMAGLGGCSLALQVFQLSPCTWTMDMGSKQRPSVGHVESGMETELGAVGPGGAMMG